jgi:hypothetical protein
MLEAPHHFDVVRGFGGKGVKKSDRPFSPSLWRLGPECPRTRQRDGRPEQATFRPETDKGGTGGGAAAAAVQPSPQCFADPDEADGAGQVQLGDLYLAFLIEVRLDNPLMQAQRHARGLKDLAAIDDAQRVIHAQSQALQNGGHMPRINAVAVDGCLPADRL